MAGIRQQKNDHSFSNESMPATNSGHDATGADDFLLKKARTGVATPVRASCNQLHIDPEGDIPMKRAVIIAATVSAAMLLTLYRRKQKPLLRNPYYSGHTV